MADHCRCGSTTHHQPGCPRGRAVADKPFRAPLFCPRCETQHVDLGGWAIKPHHRHRCAHCDFEWRVEPYTFGHGINPLKEVATLRAELATALADRDAHVRGYEAMEQRHAAVVAERDALRAAIEPTDENVKALAARVAQGDGLMAPREMHLHRVRGVLRAIAARAGKP